MIKSGMLSRLTLGSGGSDIRYDPYNLLVRYPSYTVTAKPKSRGRFTSIPSSEAVEAQIRFDTEYSHELVHWFQHHGTTVGCFLTALRAMQYQTTVNWAVGIAPKDFSNYVSRRGTSGYEPLINVSDDDCLLPIQATSELQMFSQVWYDHQLVDAMFFDSSVQETASAPRGQILGEIVGDLIALNAADSSNTTDTLALREARKLDDQSVHFAAFAKQRLTTHLLMEAAATATELLNAALVPQVLDRSAIFEKAMRSEYGLAIRILLGLYDLPLEKLENILPSLMAIIDASLNPPLPPVVNDPPPGSWCWKKLYPPLRFFALAEAAISLELLPLDADHDEIGAYQSAICEAADLPDPAQYDISHLAARAETDFASVYGDVENYARSDILFDYTRWTQSQMWQQRQLALPLFTNLAAVKAGPLARQYGPLLLDQTRSRWMTPPLIWTGTDLMGYAEEDHCFENVICLGAVYQTCAYEVAAGAGPIDLSSFPPDVRRHEPMLDTVRRSLSAHFPGLHVEFAG